MLNIANVYCVLNITDRISMSCLHTLHKYDLISRMALQRNVPQSIKSDEEGSSFDWSSVITIKNVMIFLGFCTILQSIMLFLYQFGVMSKIRKKYHDRHNRLSRSRIRLMDDAEHM